MSSRSPKDGTATAGSSLGPPEGARLCYNLDLGCPASRTVRGETAVVSRTQVCGGLRQHPRGSHAGGENGDQRGSWPPRDPPPMVLRQEGPVSPWKRMGLRAWRTLPGCSDPSEHPRLIHRPWVTRLLSQWRPCATADGEQTHVQVAASSELLVGLGHAELTCCLKREAVRPRSSRSN